MAQLAGWDAGAFGDLAIFCLYKSFGVPNGAALVGPAVRGAPRATPTGSGRGPRSCERARGWRASRRPSPRWPRRAPPPARTRRADPRDVGRDRRRHEARPSPIGPSRRRHVVAAARVRPARAGERRDNYRALLERLAPAVPEPLESSPRAPPLVFPIAVTHEKEAALLRPARAAHRAGPVEVRPPATDGRSFFPSERGCATRSSAFLSTGAARRGLDRIAAPAEEVPPRG